MIAILEAHGSTPVSSRQLLNGLPLRFEANQGRDAHPEVRFIARGPGFHLGLAPNESWLEWSANGKAGRVRTRMVKANPHTRMELENRLPGFANYFLGSGPDWHTSVAGYGSVRYREIYPGIDLVFHGEQRRLEYDFVVSPGADPGAIRLELSGQKWMRVDDAGDLSIETAAGELRWKAPDTYQEVDGKRVAVNGRFVVEKNAVRFEIGDYDRARALVIDPTLRYSTYIGGPNNEAARGVAVDGNGNIYVAGVTSSPDLPTTQGVYQRNFAGQTALNLGNFTGDGFIAKFDSNQKLIYFTYLGGSRDDGIAAITVDAAGNAYVTGGTNSTDFPTVGPYQQNYAGQPGIQFTDDIIVAKLDPTGSQLLFSTYLGGNSNDIGLSIALDKTGNVYICG
ncbi:MAG TPA: SBBP repeat-containing protein, partial [Bryobacteraceae bacterium]|nr:SBBP repeat-containing protein [Bryobacteraceae bacterium]